MVNVQAIRVAPSPPSNRVPQGAVSSRSGPCAQGAQPVRDGCGWAIRWLVAFLLLGVGLGLEAGETAASSSHAEHDQSPSSWKHVAIVSLPFRGHIVPLTRLATELVGRGHRVTIACHDEGKEYVNATGATVVSMGRVAHGYAIRRHLKQISHDTNFFRGFLSLMQDVYLPLSDPVYDAVVELIHRDKPDIIVADMGALGALDAAQKFGVPMVINNPSGVFRLDDVPHYVPAWGSGLSVAMTTWERCLSVIYPRLLSVALTPMFMDLNRLRRRRELPLLRSTSNLYANSLVLVNTAAGLEVAQTLPPLVRLTGPLMPVRPYRPSQLRHHLPSSIYKFLSSSMTVASSATSSSSSSSSSAAAAAASVSQDSDDDSSVTGTVSPDGQASLDDDNGSDNKHRSSSSSSSSRRKRKVKAKSIVVLFGQGGMSHLLPWQIKHLATALGDMNVRVLWALHTEHRSPVLQSAMFRVKQNFQPLPAVAHPSVRVVISPCGMGSAQEALYYAKPLLCIPIIGDQVDVSMRVVDAGAGIRLEKMQLNAVTVREALQKLLKDSSYRLAAKRLAKLLRSTGGTQVAADAVESVMNDGVEHLLEHGRADVPWHKAQQFDVAAVVVALMCLCLLVTHVLFSVTIHVYYYVTARLEERREAQREQEEQAQQQQFDDEQQRKQKKQRKQQQQHQQQEEEEDQEEQQQLNDKSVEEKSHEEGANGNSENSNHHVNNNNDKNGTKNGS